MHHLFNDDTKEDLGPATQEQVRASDDSEAAGHEGVFRLSGLDAGARGLRPGLNVYTEEVR